MTNVSQRALRILLVILGLDATMKGLLMIFGANRIFNEVLQQTPRAGFAASSRASAMLLMLMTQDSG